MTDQQVQIKKRVASIAQGKRVRTQDVHIPQKEKSGFICAFLVTCTLLMAVATVPVMYYKGQQKTVAVEPAVDSPIDDSQIDEYVPTHEEVQQDRWNSDLSAFGLRLSEVEGDAKKQQHRLWLLVLAHNENANLNKQMDRRHHNVKDRGYITFDEDWNFNKSPETMVLTPEQIEKIQSGVK